ncbi:MarR family transcriptional regulator [Lentzea aerocolonigenes]|uniref:MarR family transcriptional regulator n=1 Tax=Lentzea aerocolonigenes TaxID=68170 RepID=UPI000750FC6B|nr:helix-turn-helix domain-containing protein [Lentzea aerocolonigenes]
MADAFEEPTSMLAQAGLPQMAASVFACLYVIDSGSLIAAELVRQLRVSPASISKAVAFLEGQGLVRPALVSPGRQSSWTASARNSSRPPSAGGTIAQGAESGQRCGGAGCSLTQPGTSRRLP